MISGIDGFTFMKSTQSGWENYIKDPYTTIKETNDRMCATSMLTSWKWSGKPASYPAANAKILTTRWKCSAPPIATACRTACTGWVRRCLQRCRRFPNQLRLP